MCCPPVTLLMFPSPQICCRHILQLWYLLSCSTVWPFAEGRFSVRQQHSARVWISKFYAHMCGSEFILLLVSYIRFFPARKQERYLDVPTANPHSVSCKLWLLAMHRLNAPQTDYDSPKKPANNFRWRVQSRIYLQTIHKHKKKWDSLDKLCIMNYSSRSS